MLVDQNDCHDDHRHNTSHQDQLPAKNREQKRMAIVREVNEALGDEGRVVLMELIPELGGFFLLGAHADPIHDSSAGPWMKSTFKVSTIKPPASTSSVSSSKSSTRSTSANSLNGSLSSSTKKGSNTVSFAQDRMTCLFRTLIRVVTSSVPVVMSLDDVQWIDSSSLSVLGWLAVDHNIKHLLLLVSFRDNELLSTATGAMHPVTKELSMIREKKQNPRETVHHIQLVNLTEEEVNMMLASTLRKDPTDTRELSAVVYNKTAGNHFFVWQYLEMLHRREFLTLSVSDNMSWTWSSVEDIHNSTNVADNVVDLITDNLMQSSVDVRKCLMVASCVGSKIRTTLLEKLLYGLGNGYRDCNVQRALSLAVDKGFLLLDGVVVTTIDEGSATGKQDTTNTTTISTTTRIIRNYRFAHDRIQQAVFSLIPTGPLKDRLHYDIGCILLTIRDELDPSNRNWVSFVAPNQLQLGKSCLRTEKDCVCLATLHLQAGERAMAVAAFMLGGSVGLNSSRNGDWNRIFCRLFANPKSTVCLVVLIDMQC